MADFFEGFASRHVDWLLQGKERDDFRNRLAILMRQAYHTNKRFEGSSEAYFAAEEAKRTKLAEDYTRQLFEGYGHG